MPARSPLKPLSPQVFQILLSLAVEPRHGYAIIADVGDRTAGEIRLTASTLYDALARLLDDKWIKEVPAPAGVEVDDSRRRYYQITSAGRDALTYEMERLERMLASARAVSPAQAGRGRNSR